MTQEQRIPSAEQQTRPSRYNNGHLFGGICLLLIGGSLYFLASLIAREYEPISLVVRSLGFTAFWVGIWLLCRTVWLSLKNKKHSPEDEEKTAHGCTSIKES